MAGRSAWSTTCWERYTCQQDALGQARGILRQAKLDGKTLWHLLKSPENTLGRLAHLAAGRAGDTLRALLAEHRKAIESLAVDARYEGYLRKQAVALRQMQQLDSKLIPAEFDYAKVCQLRHEARENLSRVQPGSLGQASRITGITPADVTVLAIHLAAGGR